MVQLLRGVEHMHDNWLLHRDLKTSNLLLSHDVSCLRLLGLLACEPWQAELNPACLPVPALLI